MPILICSSNASTFSFRGLQKPNFLFITTISYRQINVRENFANSGENIATILKFHPNPNIIRKLDFNFCYWISSQDLCGLVKHCKNLRELSVAHSTISNRDLAEILAENVNISKLSFSIENPETFWLESELQLSSATFSLDPWANLYSYSQFGICENTFLKIQSLEIYMEQYPVILGTVLRYNFHKVMVNRIVHPLQKYQRLSYFWVFFYSACKSLQNLIIRLNLEPFVQEPSQIVCCSDLKTVLTVPLKSIILDYCSSNRMDDHMVTMMNELVRKSVVHLESLWTPTSYREEFYSIMNFDSRKMVTWVLFNKNIF